LKKDKKKQLKYLKKQCDQQMDKLLSKKKHHHRILQFNSAYSDYLSLGVSNFGYLDQAERNLQGLDLSQSPYSNGAFVGDASVLTPSSGFSAAALGVVGATLFDASNSQLKTINTTLSFC